LSPDVHIGNDQILAVLNAEVLKRDVLEGEKADDAKRKISRAAHKALRAKAASAGSTSEPQAANAPEQEGQ
jgi:hypothetical protein